MRWTARPAMSSANSRGPGRRRRPAAVPARDATGQRDAAPADLQRWGLDAVEVLELVRTAYQGDIVGQGYEGNAVFNVIVILNGPTRARLSQIGDCLSARRRRLRSPKAGGRRL